MDVRDLVRSLLTFQTLAARQWVADAKRSGFDWTEVEKPDDASLQELAVAAGVVEMFAQRRGEAPPAWTRSVASAPQSIHLVKAALTMPRLRATCEREGPEPLRRRGLFAPPDFLTIA